MLAVLPQFVGMDFEFVALVPKGRLSNALEQIGVPTVCFDVRDAEGNRRFDGHVLADFLSAVDRIRPDLLHGNSVSMGRLTGAVAGGSGSPATAHLRDIVGLSKAAVAHLNASAAFIPVSQAVRAFHESQGLDPRLMHVVPNGIDCERFRPRPPAGRLKEALHLPPDSFLIAAIGQICLRKGQDIFAKAAVIAARETPEAQFLLIGERYSAKAESIAYEARLAQEFDDAGLSHRFHRLGFRDDVDGLLNEIDLLVHSARQEPFGRVLLEAAAAGCPIIATNVGGTNEMLVDGESALLIPADDSAITATAMIRLSRDADLRQRLASAARARIVSQFTVERSALALAEVWRQVLQE